MGPALLTTADPVSLRRVFSSFPSGIAALAAIVDGVPEVLVASSFQVGISLDPPMVLFSVQRSSTTWPVLRRAERIGVSILSTAHGDIVRQLAGKDKAKRFEAVHAHRSAAGAVLLAEAALWLECEIAHDYPAGDHRLIVFRVAETAVHDVSPLVFHNSAFHRLTSLAT